MKKKTIIIAGIVCAAVAVLGTGGYFGKCVIDFNSIEKEYPSVYEYAEPYPYDDVEIPDDFRECSVKGVDFSAPDGLYWKYPEETEGLKSGILVNGSDEERTLLVCVMDEEEEPATKEMFAELGLYDKSMTEGIKRLGYDVPEDTYEILKLLYTVKPEDVNKLSRTEVDTFRGLMELKGIMSFGPYNVYTYEKGGSREFVLETVTDNGRYELTVDLFGGSGTDSRQTVIIQGDDPDTARQIVKTIKTAEE